MDEQKDQNLTTPEAPMDTTPEPVSASTFTPTAASTPSETDTMSNNRNMLFFVGVAVLVVAVVVGGYFFLNSSNESPDLTSPTGTALSEEEAAEPFVTVNGTTITRGELAENIAQVTDQARQGGFDVTDPTVIAQIEAEAYIISINNELLRQAADATVDRPTAEVVEGELATIIEQNGGAEAFALLLTEYGFTEDTLRQNISDSLHIQAYLETKITTPEITEAEIQAFYDSLGGEGAQLPPLDDAVKGQIEAQLSQTKQQEAVAAIIEELRAEATIEEIS
jgi:hypothetical protein